MVLAQRWQLKAPDGSIVSEGSEWRDRNVWDYLLMTFPVEYLPKIVQLTSESWPRAGEKATAASELL